MAKNIGALAAVAFILSTQGVTAASISETRLQELMASTSMQEVSLETLRARDREILEELARSLASRYSDVLAGSEMVFTRLSESGSLFYRLDFVGLKNKDHARALCEILEMERCIARIGDDRLTVLDVRTDPVVSAIATVEDADATPFDWIDPEPPADPNPKAREIEANVRDMLDPLGVFPEPRPEFDFLKDEVAPAQKVTASKADPSTPKKTAAKMESPEAKATVKVKAASPEATADPSEKTSAIYPLPRPFTRLSQIEHHPMPLARPLDRLAELTAVPKKTETHDVALAQVAIYPLARPFGVEVAEAGSLKEKEPAPSRLARAGSSRSLMSTSAPLVAPGGVMGGFLEVADAGVMPVATVQPKTVESPVVHIPGLGEIDVSKVRTVAPQIELARAVLPGIGPVSAHGDVAMTTDETIDSTPVAQKAEPVVERVARAAPMPMGRDAALKDMEDRRVAAADAAAEKAGDLAPKPMSRDVALLEIAPEPDAMTNVVSMAAAEEGPGEDLVVPDSMDAPEIPVQLAALDRPVGAPDVAPAAQKNPAQPVTLVADTEEAPKIDLGSAPRRITIDVPEKVEVAENEAPAHPQMKIAEAAPEQELNDIRDRAALAVAQASSKETHLGSVAFDDRYAQPASIDFNGGRVAGRLQKLPFRRPDLSDYMSRTVRSARPLREAGAPEHVAMLASVDEPFEIAQVPGSMMPPVDEAPEALDQAPFELKQDGSKDNAPLSKLDKLLAQGADKPGAKIPKPALAPKAGPSSKSAANTDIESILGRAREASRPGLDASSQAQPAAQPEKAVEASPAPKSAVEPLLLTPDMQRSAAPIAPPAAPPKPTAAPKAKPQPVAAPQPVVADKPTPRAPDASKAFVPPKEDTAQYDARKMEDTDAKTRRAMEALTQIVQERQRNQRAERAPAVAPQPAPSLAPQAAPSPRAQGGYAHPEGTMRRRPAPHAGDLGNKDVAAAREIAGYEASLSDDRTRMERAANPRGAVSPAEQMQRRNSLTQRVAPADLRIELSYVGSREQVMKRVAELKSFFPPMMMDKGRFFGASVPGQPNRFVVGFAAKDLSTRDDIIWYLEQMGIPWAIRAAVD